MLEKILYPLVVNGGIDTKSDKNLVEAGKNLTSENTALEEIGAINKRVGFTDLPDSIYGGGTLSSKGITSIFPHNNEIIAIGAAGTSEVYSFDLSSNLWHKRTSDILSPMIFGDEDYTDSFLLNSIDSVEVPVLNYRFTVCVFNTAQSGGTFRSKLVVYRTDYTTGMKKIIFQEEKNSASADAALLAKINALNTLTTNLWITYMEDDIGGATYDLKVRVLDKDGTSISGLVIEAAIGSLRSWDTIVYGSDLIVTYQSAIAQIEFAQVSQAGAITSTANFGTAANISLTIRSSIATAIYGTSLYVAYISNVASGVVRAFSIALPFGAGLGEVVKDTFAAGVYAGKVAWYVEGQGVNDKLILFYSTNISVLPYHASTGTVTPYLRSNTYFKRINPSDLSTVATDVSSGPFQGVLASKPFSTSNGIFILTQTLTPDSYSYHLCKLITDATIPTATDYQLELVGSFAVGTAYGDKLEATGADTVAGKNYLLSLPQVGESGDVYCPLVVQERSVIQYISSVDAHLGTGIATGRLFKFDFASEYNGIFSRIGENTAIAGAVMKEYDGLQLINSGFSDYPLISKLSENAVGTLPAGTYSYVCLFEFTDNNGQLWRSPVSAPLSITIVINKSIDVTFTDPTVIPIDFKSEAGVVAASIPVSQVRAILYRTEKNGTVYRRLTAITTNFQINGVLINPVNDNTPDAQIDGNELVYTDGGVLSNDIIPPFKYLLTAKNRQFAISSEDENLIYYSQPYLSGESVNWSQALTTRVDAGTLSNTGKAIAIASMVDKIVVLKSSSIVAFVGDGPNALGEDNNFTSPTLISANIGCVDPKSVVTIPSGIMFKSENGIYLLDRGMNAAYIGADVEAYNSETIVSAQNIPKTNKVLLLTSSRSMIYDYMMGSWMTWTIGGQAACIWNSQITILKDGVVKYQSTGYKDGSSFYSMKLATPWLKISGIQEFQRIYKIIILGAYKSAHTLTVKVYFDYDETDFETHTLSPVIGDKVYQYEVSMTNQKCQSFKLEIYDNVNAGTGQGFKLSNITLQLGQKRGFNKLSAIRKY